MIELTETITRLDSNVPDMITVIQITDTHILDDGAPSFNDYDTSASLIEVIEKIKEAESDADLILLTGDLVHEPTESAYQKLADYLSVLTTPILFLPGNHDLPDLMKYVMGANGHDMGNLIKFDDWLIILLNTCVEGEHSGELSPEELVFLRTSLNANPDLHCLIALHHHPVTINSRWMDAMALLNAEEFLKITDDFEQIRAIIWGHIHQEFECERANVRLLGTPSTCLQFIPGSDEFAVDKKTPAYRKLTLKKDGTVYSNVIYMSK
jgi:3',5'-cyclic-AMP phosphodiesterase